MGGESMSKSKNDEKKYGIRAAIAEMEEKTNNTGRRFFFFTYHGEGKGKTARKAFEKHLGKCGLRFSNTGFIDVKEKGSNCTQSYYYYNK